VQPPQPSSRPCAEVGFSFAYSLLASVVSGRPSSLHLRRRRRASRWMCAPGIDWRPPAQLPPASP